MSTETNAPPREMSLMELAERFPDDDSARAWFEEVRWGGVPYCPHCGSDKAKPTVHRSMTHRCGEKGCRKRFSVKVGTPMQSSRLSYKKWAWAIYLLSSEKAINAAELGRSLGIPHATAWRFAHKIREAWDLGELPGFTGEVEVDETYIGGKQRNMHAARRKQLGSGTDGKFPVLGVMERDTGRVVAAPADSVNLLVLKRFVEGHTAEEALVYADDNPSYNGVRRRLETVAHSRGEYVRGDVSTNSIESFWALVKRAYHTHYWWSRRHLHRYINERCWRHNHRHLGTLDRMAEVVRCMAGKRLTYADLAAKPSPLVPSQGVLDLR